MPTTSLPVWQLRTQILEHLRSKNRLVLVAPTGSGKTTQVPQMLLDSDLATRKIIILQPRRVAARTVAARVAYERGSTLGTEVGYQIRFDDVTSTGTRISYITEGILLRRLQDDRTLSDTDVVIFDEFHERNLLSDVALALVKHLQTNHRPDLKMIVMSATMEAEPVAEYLSAAVSKNAVGEQARDRIPILISEGQTFPVETEYLKSFDERPLTEQAADCVERLVNAEEPGDVLVFMPGMSEINATISALHACHAAEKLALIPLHGDLPAEQQDLAFAPNSLRKIVVATNVAETSITIEGIRHVVDSGVARVARYDAERGISTLLLEPISRASADQRKGRAGRTAPGKCYRLWTESAHLDRPERNTPEIQRSDLAETVLLLHSLGIKKATQFDWLDKPDLQAVERAEELLHVLGALKTSPKTHSVPFQETKDGALSSSTSDLTSNGRKMLRLPMHPRYSRILVEAAKYDCVPGAALCSALVSGRDLLMRLSRDDKFIKEARELFEGSQDSDFYTLMRAFQFAKKSNFATETCRRYGIHAQTARQVDQTFQQLLSMAEPLMKESPDASTREDAQKLLDPLPRCIMTGFIDQLCIRRDLGSLECDLTEGRHGTLMRESVVQNSTLFVAASIREVLGRDSKNFTLLGLATAVKLEWIKQAYPEQLSDTIEHLYDRTHKRVAALKLLRFHDLVIAHEHLRDLDPQAAGRTLADAYLKEYFELPLFNHEIKQFIARVNLVNAAMPEIEIPPLDQPAIKARLSAAFSGLSLAKEAQTIHLRDAFSEHLAKEQLAWLDELTPSTILWPDGRRLKLLYQDQDTVDTGPIPPELQVKLTECFVLKEHPHICEGRVPVKLWLCKPDGKRIESTLNWITFKSNSYPKLRSLLQKQFPGNAWP